MKYIVLLLACVAFVRADQWNELNLDDESEARLLFNTNGTGSSLIPDGRAILGFVLVGVLLFALLGGQNLLPAERQQQYGDYYNQEYAQDYQTFSARYGLAGKFTRNNLIYDSRNLSLNLWDPGLFSIIASGMVTSGPVSKCAQGLWKKILRLYLLATYLFYRNQT